MYKDITKTDGTLKQGYYFVFNQLLSAVKIGNREKDFYLKSWAVSRSHKNLIESDYFKMCGLLDALNIPYTLGNSKRGGAESDYIRVKLDKRLKAVKWLKSLNYDFLTRNDKLTIDLFN